MYHKMYFKLKKLITLKEELEVNVLYIKNEVYSSALTALIVLIKYLYPYTIHPG